MFSGNAAKIYLVNLYLLISEDFWVSLSFLNDSNVFVPSDKCPGSTANAGKSRKSQKSSLIGKEKVNKANSNIYFFLPVMFVKGPRVSKHLFPNGGSSLVRRANSVKHPGRSYLSTASAELRYIRHLRLKKEEKGTSGPCRDTSMTTIITAMKDDLKEKVHLRRKDKTTTTCIPLS